MPLIKLDAIDSTNDFLKALTAAQKVENFTIVTAETQTKGRGQMGAKWHSESGKNLIMSVLVKDALTDVSQIFDMNIAVALSIVKTLAEIDIPELAVKWPNDIMSGAKKIGGILIENSIKSDGRIFSIIGIGLNVNQLGFDGLPKATSLAVLTAIHYDREKLITAIAANMEFYSSRLQIIRPDLWTLYSENLFRKGVPMPFENSDGNRFMGIIQGVNENGRLVVLLEDETMATFGIKEIQMLY